MTSIAAFPPTEALVPPGPAVTPPWPQGLRLRRRNDADSPGILALMSQPDFQRHACTMDPFTSIDDVETFARGNGPRHLEMVATIEATIVGFVGVYVLAGRQAHVGSFTLGVHEAFQRRGIGTLLMRALLGAGFVLMGLERIQATVFADNTRALALYQRAGFSTEGRLSRFVRREDGFIDAFLIAATAPSAALPDTWQ